MTFSLIATLPMARWGCPEETQRVVPKSTHFWPSSPGVLCYGRLRTRIQLPIGSQAYWTEGALAQQTVNTSVEREMWKHMQRPTGPNPTHCCCCLVSRVRSQDARLPTVECRRIEFHPCHQSAGPRHVYSFRILMEFCELSIG